MPTKSRIFVFQLGQRLFFAYSLDRTGANVPGKLGDAWLLRGTLASLDVDLDETQLLQMRKALVTDGYYFLRIADRFLESQ
jgi:hypothetical protein